MRIFFEMSRELALLIPFVLFVSAISYAKSNSPDDFSIKERFYHAEDDIQLLDSGKNTTEKNNTENISVLRLFRKTDPPKSEERKKVDYTKLKWVTEIFDEAKRMYEIDPAVSPKCFRDYQFYKQHLQNQSLWAVKMLESTEWPSVGVFAGMTYHYGNYDECIRSSAYSVKGQYCMPSASFSIKGNSDWSSSSEINSDSADLKSSVWDGITVYRNDPVRVKRTKLNWAICLPASCTTKDLKMSLDRVVVPLFNKHQLDVKIEVDPDLCTTDDKNPPSTGYYVASYVLYTILLVIILATLYDWNQDPKDDVKKVKKESMMVKLLTSFSVVKNVKKLGKYDKSNDIAAIHFVKVTSILIVVYGHRYIYSVGFPKTFTEFVEGQYKTFTSIELVHTNIVDVFFMVSGYLTYHFGYRPMSKAGEIYYPMSLLLRWLRMVPVFGVVMVFIIYILPYMSDGPLWNYRVLREADNCATTWWASLLAVNNFVRVEKQCLVVSWYISTDIQLCIIGGFLLYLITKNKTVGLIATAFVFLLSSAITFIVAYVNRYDGLLKLYVSLLEEPRKSIQFTQFYIATYTRVGPYLAGFIAAHVTKILLARGFKLTTRQITIVLILAIVIGDGGQYYGYLMYAFGRPYNAIENALYAAINRTLFASIYAVWIAVYVTTGLGVINKFVQLKLFVPLGRLTYSVFLVNTVIQLYHAASQRSPLALFSRMQLVWLVLSDILLSYLFGFFLHLYVEAPLTNITKMFQKKITKMTVKRIPPEILVNGDTKPPSKQSIANPIQRSPSIGSDIRDGVSKMIIPNGYSNDSYINTEIDQCRL